ncbi:ammonium transporter [Leifsonia xyli]|nr:ammonium transporter [Leifsonia xyli]
MAATSQQVDALLLLVFGALTLLAVPSLGFLSGGLGGRQGVARAVLFGLTGTAVVVLLGVAGGFGMVTGRALVPHLLGHPDPWLVAAAKQGVYGLARAGSALALCAVATSLLGVAVASRITLRAWLLFAVLWSALVLAPVGYGALALSDGWAVAGLGAINFGGALLVLAAGASAAGVLLACGRGEHIAPGARHLRLVAIGGALLLAGWFGLTAASEGAVDSYTALIVVNSFLAAAGGCLMWLLVDRVFLRRPTIASAFCGALSGLVAVTAGSGVLTLGWSLLLGALAALACATMVDLAARARLGVAMTVIVIATVASLVGLLFPGLFASGAGMVDSGNFDLFMAQAVAGLSVLIGVFLVSAGLALVLRLTIGLTRVRSGVKRPERDREPPAPHCDG